MDFDEKIISKHWSFKFNTKYTFSYVKNSITATHYYIEYTYMIAHNIHRTCSFAYNFINNVRDKTLTLVKRDGCTELMYGRKYIKLEDIVKYNVGQEHHDKRIIKILMKYPHKFNQRPTKIVDAYHDMTIKADRD